MAADNASDPDCVFCRIARGDLPAQKVYEDEHLLAFMDIAPLADGHLLVIPKRHVDWLTDCQPAVMAALGRRLPALAKAVVEAVGAEGFNVLNNNGRISGQAVAHLHVHIIPRKHGDELGFRWPAMADYPKEKLEQLGRRIEAALEAVEA